MNGIRLVPACLQHVFESQSMDLSFTCETEIQRHKIMLLGDMQRLMLWIICTGEKEKLAHFCLKCKLLDYLFKYIT